MSRCLTSPRTQETGIVFESPLRFSASFLSYEVPCGGKPSFRTSRFQGFRNCSSTSWSLSLMFAQQTFVVFQQPVSTSPAVRRDASLMGGYSPHQHAQKPDYLMLPPFTFRSVPLKNLIGEVFKLQCVLWFSAHLHNRRSALSYQSLKVIEKFNHSPKYSLVIKITASCFPPALKRLGFHTPGIFI